jgi:predicted flap endonuclease-1-like 5' DNA nuclease
MKNLSSNASENDLPKLSAPAHRALASLGITRLEQFANFTEKDIKNLHGIGPKVMKELHEALAQRGLAFAAEK